MPPRPSTDRGGGLQRDVRSLQRLTASLMKHDNTPDVKCWDQIAMSLVSVLRQILHQTEAGITYNRAGHQAVLECMQAIVEHAPAAMRAAVSSRQGQMGQLGILVVPHALCGVLHLINEQVNWPAAWPSGLQSAASSALAEVLARLPQTALNDPFVMVEISHTTYSLSIGRIDLPLKQTADLILFQV